MRFLSYSNSRSLVFRYILVAEILFGGLLSLLWPFVARAEVVEEAGSLLEFYAGHEQNCAYDNWLSHVSEGVARAGFNDYAPAALDRETNGFGRYTVIDSLPNPDQTLAYFYRVLAHLQRGNLEAAAAVLDSSGFGDRYQIVRLRDGNRRYAMLRERLNNNYHDDNGTEAADDDVTGSFDLGWGLFVYDLDPSTPNVAIEAPHPEEDYISTYVAIDAFLTIGARALFVAGANREALWTNEGNYDNTKTLSDPTRAQKSIFTQAHKVFVDSVRNDFVIQVHSYDSRQRRLQQCLISTYTDNHPNRPIFDRRSNFDILHLSPRYPIEANTIGNHNHDAVRIDDYMAIWNLGDSIFYDGNINIGCTLRDLAGWYSPQRRYSLIGQDTLNSDENFMHVELDEFPNVITEPILEFYPVGGVPTYRTFANAVAFYHPLFVAVNAYYHRTTVRHVPGEYAHIQDAIDASFTGDTVLVSPGRYNENLNFHGKSPIVASLFARTQNPRHIDSTIISGTRNGSVVAFAKSEESPKLIGFTLRDGRHDDGGAIYCVGASPTIENCLIYDNSANRTGGAIYCEAGSLGLVNCTVTDNRAGAVGGAVFCVDGGRVTAINTIFWNDRPQEIYFSAEGDSNLATFSYCDASGGEQAMQTQGNGRVVWGEGCIDQNPSFLSNHDEDDQAFHLRRNSPCINTGDPGVRVDLDNSRSDIGALARLTRGMVVSPQSLSFSNVFQNEIDSLPLVVSNRGYDSFNLREWEISPPEAPFSFGREPDSLRFTPGTTHVLWVIYSPLDSANHEATIQLESDERDEPPFTIEVRGSPLGVDGGKELLPASLALKSIFPNPFNSTTVISYDLPNDGAVRLSIYNVAGQRVAELAGSVLPAGTHRVRWDASGFATGVYFVRLETVGDVRTSKILLVR